MWNIFSNQFLSHRILRNRFFYRNSFPTLTIFLSLVVCCLYLYSTPADFARLVIGNPFSAAKLLKVETVGRQKLSPKQIYDRLAPSVVAIESSRGVGTGVILHTDGFVLTNKHVLGSGPRLARQYRVLLKNQRQFTGTLIGSEYSFDLALLKLESATGLTPIPWANYPKDPPPSQRQKFSHCRISVLFSCIVTENEPDERLLVNSEPIYAIGVPSREPWRMTTGTLYGVSGGDAQIPWETPFRTLISEPGLLSPGFSGGPLINAYGQVVGINYAMQRRDGYGMSISIETVRGFLDEVLPKIRQDPRRYDE